MASHQCTQCNKFFHSTAIQKHRQRPHIYCPHCKRFFLQKEWQTHKRTCDGSQLGESCACGARLPSKAFTKHTARPHGTQRCGRFILLSERRSHQMNCEQCKDFERTSMAYLTKAKEGFCVARTECRAIISCGATSSRSKEQGPIYLNVLDNLISGTPITAAEYSPASEYLRNTFVLCSTAEARRILEAGSPKIPILIPAEWNQDRNTLSMAQFLEYLMSFATVDIHDFDQALPDGVITPRSMDPSSALALFRDPAHGPVSRHAVGQVNN